MRYLSHFLFGYVVTLSASRRFRSRFQTNFIVIQAWKRIQDQINEKSMKKLITNEVIAFLTRDEEEEIMGLEEKYSVTVRRNINADE